MVKIVVRRNGDRFILDSTEDAAVLLEVRRRSKDLRQRNCASGTKVRASGLFEANCVSIENRPRILSSSVSVQVSFCKQESR